MRLLLTILMSTAGIIALAEETAEPAATLVTHAGLAVTIPAHWQPHRSISPSIAVWRAALETDQDADDATQAYAQPSLAISQQTRSRDVDWEILVTSIRKQLKDLYTDVTIYDDKAITIDQQVWWRMEASFQVGTLTWRQSWLFTLQHPHPDMPAELYSVVLSSLDAAWPQWQDTRQGIEASLHWHRDAQENNDGNDGDDASQ
ncbi:MAG: hypothetical protein EA401_02920 [Planctomycetota bacterium]|nr:MAG: hypothetical protein EA401_02920 [Planctomycetota bacterium]